MRPRDQVTELISQLKDADSLVLDLALNSQAAKYALAHDFFERAGILHSNFARKNLIRLKRLGRAQALSRLDALTQLQMASMTPDFVTHDSTELLRDKLRRV